MHLAINQVYDLLSELWGAEQEHVCVDFGLLAWTLRTHSISSSQFFMQKYDPPEEQPNTDACMQGCSLNEMG